MTFRLLLALCFVPLVASAQERFRDRTWLWCHVAGAHDDGSTHFFKDASRRELSIGVAPHTANRYRFKHSFTVSPAEAAAALGIENILMVKYNIGPNPGPQPGTFAEYYDEHHLAGLKNVMWSLVGEGGRTSGRELSETLSLAEAKTNICGFIMDDFFVRPDGRRPLSPIRLRALQREITRTLPGRVHHKLWVVLYDSDVTDPQFYTDFAPWLREVDGITLWFRGQNSLTRKNMEKTLARLEWLIARFERPPQIILGCYLWRYLERHHGEITPKKMTTQLDFAEDHLSDGRLGGVIFLGSPIVQLSHDAPARNNVLAVKQWMEANGDRVITALQRN